MPKTESQKRAQQKYIDKFFSTKIRLEKELHSTIQAHAAKHGESMNTFIVRSCINQMQRDSELETDEKT